MRILLKLGIGIAALGVVAAVAVVMGLPHVLTGEFVRGAVRTSFGTDLQFERLELEVYPPKLLLIAPTLTGGDSGGVDAGVRFASAKSATLEVALAPLLARVLLVDSARIDGAVVNLERSKRGVRLAGTHPTDPNPPVSAAASGPDRRFAIRALELSGATLVLDDRTVEPALHWELRDVHGSARGTSVDAPVLFGLTGELASGGRVNANGESTLDGDIDLLIELDDVSLSTAAAYFESQGRLEGRLTGTIDINPSRVKLDWKVSDARVRLDDISLRGELKIEARIKTDGDPVRGRVELDATEARLRYGSFFTKPPGTRASVTGRIRAKPDGTLTVEKWKFEMSDFEGQAATPNRAQFERRFARR